MKEQGGTSEFSTGFPDPVEKLAPPPLAARQPPAKNSRATQDDPTTRKSKPTHETREGAQLHTQKGKKSKWRVLFSTKDHLHLDKGSWR